MLAADTRIFYLTSRFAIYFSISTDIHANFENAQIPIEQSCGYCFQPTLHCVRV